MKDKNICVRLTRDEKQIERAKLFLVEKETFVTLKANTISLLGNKVRLSIVLLLLQEKQLCVCDLSDILDMKVPAISQHLRKLKDRNLVFFTREGTVLYYQISESIIPFVNSLFTENEDAKLSTINK